VNKPSTLDCKLLLAFPEFCKPAIVTTACFCCDLETTALLSVLTTALLGLLVFTVRLGAELKNEPLPFPNNPRILGAGLATTLLSCPALVVLPPAAAFWADVR
jgi:hypothetical protein